MSEDNAVHLHLVSDATGETVHQVARACMSQFEGFTVIEHTWSLVRTPGHAEKVVRGVEAQPGPILYTAVNDEVRERLQVVANKLGVPHISILDPALAALHGFLGAPLRKRPGMQHTMDNAYFNRIEAMNYTLAHDDGQITHDLDNADIVLVGVSRTSKTPTCLYLANRGYKAANIPLVPGIDPPAELFTLKKALVIGLMNSPERLVQVRRNRLLNLQDLSESTYVDLDEVKEEVRRARILCRENDWPVIDVSRRSIEETSAAILNHYEHRNDG